MAREHFDALLFFLPSLETILYTAALFRRMSERRPGVPDLQETTKGVFDSHRILPNGASPPIDLFPKAYPGGSHLSESLSGEIVIHEGSLREVFFGACFLLVQYPMLTQPQRAQRSVQLLEPVMHRERHRQFLRAATLRCSTGSTQRSQPLGFDCGVGC